jgi:guanylate kinase
MADKQESLIIIVSAPSGSGKTTIVEHLIKKIPGVSRSVSYTTREPREGENDGKDYMFVAVDEFKQKINNGDFLEWEENFGSYYGTPRAQIEDALKSGTDVILSIDVKGARSVKKTFPESISVFIMPPSLEELETRLRKRNTDQKQQVSLRMEESRREMASADEYEYLIINEDLESAVKELAAIIEDERKNRKTNAEKETE